MSILNKSTLLTKANIIKNETVDAANSATRVGTMFVDEVDTLFNLFCRIDKVGKYGFKYTISGYDPADVQLQVVKWNRKGRNWRFVSGRGLVNQPMEDLQLKFVDASMAMTAKPRVSMVNNVGYLSYDTRQSIDPMIVTILQEMSKLRTNAHFEQILGDSSAIWYNKEKVSGGYYNCETRSYDDLIDDHYNSPRYGLALTYRGVIVSNILPVKIYYVPNTSTMGMKNI